MCVCVFVGVRGTEWRVERKQEWVTDLERIISHQQVPLSKIITNAPFPFLVKKLLSSLIKGAGVEKAPGVSGGEDPCTGAQSLLAFLSLNFPNRVGGALVLPQVPLRFWVTAGR